MVANEMRLIMADLGVATVNELIGRADLLKTDGAIQHWIFNDTKTIVSVYDDRLSGKFDKNFLKKIQFDKIIDQNLSLLKTPTYDELYKLSLTQADGVIFTSSSAKEKFKDFVKKNTPTLECSSNEDYQDKYLEFYNSFLDE